MMNIGITLVGITAKAMAVRPYVFAIPEIVIVDTRLITGFR